MDKFKKIGLSALCGSLAALTTSANAGELTVLGGTTATWSSNEGETTGNPIGISSGLTFTGSGELDNGTTFKLTMTHADQDAWSAGSINMTFPSMGSFKIGSADGGGGIGGYDDKMPTAWEETWGTSVGTGIDLAKGSGSSMYLQYSTPAIAGVSLKAAFSPDNDGKQATDKGSGGDAGATYKNSADLVLDISAMGQNVFTGYSVSARHDSQSKPRIGTGTEDGNTYKQEGVAGAIFNIGPVQLGAQVTGEFLGNEQTASDIFGYRNVAYGVSFNVNDNLSLSYGRMESKQGSVSADAKEPVLMTIESYQAAYTMGGATIKIAETEVDNAKYTSGTANDNEGTTIALSLAF